MPAPRPAFTLLEVLIVVGLIALLAAILAPSLQAVRHQGRLTLCLSNLREQGVTVHAYASDNDGRLPPRHYSRVGSAAGESLLINAFLARYLHQPFPDLGQEFPVPTGIWRCPNVSGAEEALRRTHSGYLHHAPNRWLFNAVVYHDASRQLEVFGEGFVGWRARSVRAEWTQQDRVHDPSKVVSLIDNVTPPADEHDHPEARESIGGGCEIMAKRSGADCGDNQSSHAPLTRLPALFLDGHGYPLSTTRAYWQDASVSYRPGDGIGHAVSLYARDIEHFIWFIRAADLVPDE
jgi:prepilin-type N-terminal cleavage/methylation domain-containing protein